MAEGLYVKLDVSYADDEKVIAAGEKAEVLYVRSLCLAKRLLGDGFIADAHLPRFHLTRWQGRAKALVREGLWRRDDDRGGYWIVAWSKWNRSAADVQAQREEASALGVLGNHRRWHKTTRVPDCPHCIAPDDRVPDPQSDPQPDPDTPSSTRSPEAKTESEAEKKDSSPAASVQLVDDLADAFVAFWQQSPKKAGKADAERKFRIAAKKRDRWQLVEDMRAYRDNPARKPDFTLNPATWLHQERWADETDVAPPPAMTYGSGEVTYR